MVNMPPIQHLFVLTVVKASRERMDMISDAAKSAVTH